MRKIVDFLIFLIGMVVLAFAYFLVDSIIAWYERCRMTDKEKEKISWRDNRMNRIDTLKSFCDDLGIDLSKWDIENDKKINTYSDEDICRELTYRNKNYGEYTIYVVIQNYQGSEWMVIEFSMNGD